jgi:hypothetical protein
MEAYNFASSITIVNYIASLIGRLCLMLSILLPQQNQLFFQNTFFKQGSISVHQTVMEAYNFASSITIVNYIASLIGRLCLMLSLLQPQQNQLFFSKYLFKI